MIAGTEKRFVHKHIIEDADVQALNKGRRRKMAGLPVHWTRQLFIARRYVDSKARLPLYIRAPKRMRRFPDTRKCP